MNRLRSAINHEYLRTHAERNCCLSLMLDVPLGLFLCRADLLEQAGGEAEFLEKTPYGQKYGISGKLTGPNGKFGQVMTVWIVLAGQENPRLVTAYPDE